MIVLVVWRLIRWSHEFELSFQCFNCCTRCARLFALVVWGSLKGRREIDRMRFSWSRIFRGRSAAFKSLAQFIDESVVELVQTVLASNFCGLWRRSVVHILIPCWTHDQRRLRRAWVHTRELVTRSRWRHVMQVAVRRWVREGVVRARRCWKWRAFRRLPRPSTRRLRWYRPAFAVLLVHLVDVVVVSHQRNLKRHRTPYTFSFST